jgi:4-diphosphocytidyl-2-C-methyl-D-erythritol kinase
MRFYARAKINWTLEVLSRREDGYHEVRTVMQAIDLCDELEIEPADELRLEVEGPHEASEDDLALRAAALLDGGGGRGARVRLTKRIPVAAGLGGGSDAAASCEG